MFIPNHYAENDVEIQKKLIKETGLGTLITTSPNGEYNANPIPFILTKKQDGKLYLQAHFNRKNEIGEEIEALSKNDPTKNVLVVFQGPHDYVTPTWYPTKETTGKVAPTWLYAAVQVYGKPRLVKDLNELHVILRDLTDHFESTRKIPWSIDEAPESFLNMVKKTIYGLEIEVTKMEGKFKMNQPSPEQDIKGTIKGFKERDDPNSQIMGDFVEQSLDRYKAAKVKQ